MAERESLSPSRRWRVFARDNFTCRYCGARPPDAVLHVDHVLAVANGGTNDDANLATACASCNGGKGASLLAEHIAETQPATAQLEKFLEVRDEFNAVFGRLFAHMVKECGALESKGVSFDAAALTLVLALSRMAAFLWLRCETNHADRDFIALCRASLEEEKGDRA